MERTVIEEYRRLPDEEDDDEERFKNVVAFFWALGWLALAAIVAYASLRLFNAVPPIQEWLK